MIRIALQEVKESLLHLVFPHLCQGCGSDILDKESLLCLHCIHTLPFTGFEKLAGNAVEKKFYGRLPLQCASAAFHFTKDSLLQHLVHQVKYASNKALGLELGGMMGHTIRQSGRFPVDVLVPLPLFPDRQKKRGYNQSALLCNGISAEMKLPVAEDIVYRQRSTATQTRKSRIERWDNMQGGFQLKNSTALAGKHVLLVDDVVTTGATLEACGAELLKIPGLLLSVAVLGNVV